MTKYLIPAAAISVALLLVMLAVYPAKAGGPKYTTVDITLTEPAGDIMPGGWCVSNTLPVFTCLRGTVNGYAVESYHFSAYYIAPKLRSNFYKTTVCYRFEVDTTGGTFPATGCNSSSSMRLSVNLQ